MKKLFASILCVLMVSSAAYGLNYQLSDFMEGGSTGMDVGYTLIDSKSFFKAGFTPNVPIGPLEVGLNVNLYFPLGDYDTPDSVSWLAFRHVAYDYEKKHGFKWGRLQRVTLGNGLLVDNFDSGSGGTSEFTNDKAGLLAYATIYDAKITAMQTAQNVQALRVQRPIYELGSAPIILGGTYITDTDGVDDDSSGEQVTRPEQSGYEVDISYPIGGPVLTTYIEYAELTDQGKGASTGLRGSIIEVIDYRAEYRVLGKGFVPGYFNSAYQSTGFDFTSGGLAEETAGFLVNASSSFMNGYAKAGLQYEKYDDINVLSGSLGWRKIGPVTGVINLTKPFNAEDNRAVAIADLYYVTGKIYDLILRVKRVYESTDEYTQSVSVAMKINTSSLLPF